MTETKKPVSAAEKKRQQIRDILWPGVDEDQLWRRKKSTGFTTIPRTMPLIIEIINRLTKGKPAGPTYLELWCRAFDECFVDLDEADNMAFCSGFTGQRASNTWRGRVQDLKNLGFLDIRAVGGKEYALIFNPYLVIQKLKATKVPGLTDNHYNALLLRATDIGASDLKAAE